jgi:hypothetical protein
VLRRDQDYSSHTSAISEGEVRIQIARPVATDADPCTQDEWLSDLIAATQLQSIYSLFAAEMHGLTGKRYAEII